MSDYSRILGMSQESLEKWLDMLVVFRPDGKFDFINQQFCARTGWTSDEVIGECFSNYLHHDDKVSAEFFFRGLAGEGSLANEGEFRFRNSLGSYRVFSCNAIKSAETTFILATLRDVTAVRQTYRLTESVLDNLPVVLFAKDTRDDFRFSMWNKKAEQVFGLPAAKILGKSDYDLFPKEQADFFRAKDKETVNAKQLVEVKQEPVNTALGKLWLHTYKVPVFDADGNPETLLGISEDITEHVQTNEQLQIQRERAHHAEKMASLGEVAGGIAHEINNPLLVITGNIQLLLSKLARPEFDREDAAKSLEKVLSTAFRIDKLVRGMRQLTRGGGDNVRVKIDIKKVVTDTLDLSRKFLENLGIRIEVDYPTQETQVICDPGQLTQVLMNLINNAADAIHGLSEKWIRLSWKQVKDNLVIRVMDSGRGIPPEILVKIMQPFFTTKELGRGAGLGLSISKAIVENHGGQLVYEEQSGHTSFRVELKVA